MRAEFPACVCRLPSISPSQQSKTAVYPFQVHIALTALAHNSLTAGLNFYKNNFVCMALACLGLPLIRRFWHVFGDPI